MPRSTPTDAADVALLYSPTEDGQGARILRARKGRLEPGEVRPVKDGKPLMGSELVRLTPREGAPSTCDVEVLHERAAAPTTDGPPKVATEAYRAQWDRIFKPRARAPREAN